MATNPSGRGRPGGAYFLIAAVVALLIAIGASYAAVVSQNPGPAADQPLAVYGQVSP